jgi:hypothetical protein
MSDAQHVQAALGKPDGYAASAARCVKYARAGGKVEQAGYGLRLGERLGGRMPEPDLQLGLEADEPVVGDVHLHLGASFRLRGNVRAGQRAEPSAGCCKRFG